MYDINNHLLYRTCKPYSFMQTAAPKGNSQTLFRKVLRESTLVVYEKITFFMFQKTYKTKHSSDAQEVLSQF